MKVACLQTNPKETIEEALQEALDLALSAVKSKSQFIFLPEYCGGIVSNGKLYTPPSQPENKHVFLTEFKKFCILNAVWTLIGSIAIQLDSNKIVNRSFIINPKGEIISKYDKIHMFDIFLEHEEHFESETIKSGDQAILVQTEFCKIGHSICYDIRFPQLYRQLSQAGAEVIVIPSAFTKITGSAHWHVLNRSRAIENSCYIISPCAVGSIPGGGDSYGHSLIIDPWGKIIKDGGISRGIITADLDLSLVNDYRKKIPSLKHDKHFKVKKII